MQLIIDYSNARMTRCHSYVGITARIDDRPSRAITITHDGCYFGNAPDDGVTTESFSIDESQAWSVAMLLTGRETAKPIDGGFRDEETRTVAYALRSRVRPPICDVQQSPSTILQPLL